MYCTCYFFSRDTVHLLPPHCESWCKSDKSIVYIRLLPSLPSLPPNHITDFPRSLRWSSALKHGDSTWSPRVHHVSSDTWCSRQRSRWPSSFGYASLSSSRMLTSSHNAGSRTLQPSISQQPTNANIINSNSSLISSNTYLYAQCTHKR